MVKGCVDVGVVGVVGVGGVVGDGGLKEEEKRGVYSSLLYLAVAGRVSSDVFSRRCQ
jgi:hypothetical protein